MGAEPSIVLQAEVLGGAARALKSCNFLLALFAVTVIVFQANFKCLDIARSAHRPLLRLSKVHANSVLLLTSSTNFFLTKQAQCEATANLERRSSTKFLYLNLKTLQA